MNSIALTPKELREVTGYVQATKQIDVLQHMAIPFRVRPNGTIFVAKDDLAMTTRKVKKPSGSFVAI